MNSLERQANVVPPRLSDLTHELARRALSGEHGRDMKTAVFNLDESQTAGLSPDMRYARATMLVAEKAPLRILPGERIVGSATLLEAVRHQTPVAGVGSTSHTTIGFHRVLKTGYRNLRGQINDRLSRRGLDGKGEDFLKAMIVCLEAAGVWHRRHLDLLTQLADRSEGATRENYRNVRRALVNVPENPPATFHEAVQSLWFMFEFQRLMGNWSGLGRMDEMLGPYLDRDLREERITLDEAREILAHFWIHGAEWAGLQYGSGDAQHYQNVILGGVNAEGRDVTNEVTYLVLDIVEALRISDFPIAVRLNAKSPDRLLTRIAEVQRGGGGIVSVYSEDVAIDGLVKFGYSGAEARTFTNDGCWELLIPGRTLFGYSPFDMLSLLQDVLGLKTADVPAPDFQDFESLYRAFLTGLERRLEQFHGQADRYATSGPPSPLLSLLVEDCIERGRGYHDRGARYTVLAPHAGGMSDTANALLVLRALVYEQKMLSLPQFVAILRNDWNGQESLRRLVKSKFAFYGNDSEPADAMMQRLFNDYTDCAWKLTERNGVMRPAGISTFGREIDWAKSRTASPAGSRRGDVLATNFSPSPGTDMRGPTAAVRSYCRVDFTRAPNGATLELKIHPSCVQGEDGLRALVALLRTFVQLRGFYLSVDVVDTATLLDAQQHPERYPNLMVRISGWSSRFATMNKEWQDMIIARTQQMIG